jgi:hypothetical protein
VVYDRLSSEIADMKARFGGLPSPTEAEPIWRDIWYEEAHNSTALEGNTLALREVEELLRKKKAVGNKELRDYLEVRGYAEAAQWVYSQGMDAGGWMGGPLVSLVEIREIHRLTVAPVWEFSPPPNALPEETPGDWRRHEIEPMASGMTPPPFTDIPALMTDWVDRAASLKGDDPFLLERVAELHAAFERIHPFLDGNGRAGRLVLNLILVRLGFPPALIYARDRGKYLDALKRADDGDAAPLGELLARAVLNNLVRLVYPAIAGDVKLIPLEALASKDLSAMALRQAATRGRLRAVQGQDRVWRSTKRWVADYRASKYQTLKRQRIVGRVASVQGVARVAATGVVTNPENKSVSQP